MTGCCRDTAKGRVDVGSMENGVTGRSSVIVNIGGKKNCHCNCRASPTMADNRRFLTFPPKASDIQGGMQWRHRAKPRDSVVRVRAHVVGNGGRS